MAEYKASRNKHGEPVVTITLVAATTPPLRLQPTEAPVRVRPHGERILKGSAVGWQEVVGRHVAPCTRRGEKPMTFFWGRDH